MPPLSTTHLTRAALAMASFVSLSGCAERPAASPPPASASASVPPAVAAESVHVPAPAPDTSAVVKWDTLPRKSWWRFPDQHEDEMKLIRASHGLVSRYGDTLVVRLGNGHVIREVESSGEMSDYWEY